MGVGTEAMIQTVSNNEATYTETELTSLRVAPDYTDMSQTQVTVNPLSMYSPIEKSQMYIKGNYEGISHPQTQPSAHIGLRPIIALDPASASLANISAWTSACAHWTIETEMDVEEHVPTRWAFGPPNIGFKSAMYKAGRYPEYNDDPRYITGTYGGLHLEQRITVVG